MKHITLWLCILPLWLSAQKKTNEYADTDRKMLNLPETVNVYSTASIRNYIGENFPTETEKMRAVYIWITENFKYDVENMFAINFYQNTNEVVDEILTNRKGICMHFAELFSAVANELGIKTYVISGYTKQNGFVDYVPHAWCAAYVDSTWLLFDPTWGSGYIQNQKFVKKRDNYYFKTKPENLIKSHMPFDPLWQFLNYPITSQEFYEGKTKINENKPFFNYADTLAAYENETTIERLESESQRIKANGVKNSMVYNKLENNTREITYLKNKQLVEDYNSAVYCYNEGLNKLNVFIEYRNNQFTPEETEDEIRNRLDVIENTLQKSSNLLSLLSTIDTSLINSMNQLNTMIKEAMLVLNEQKAFVDKYFSTKKIFRKSLFYKYTWMGIPLN